MAAVPPGGTNGNFILLLIVISQEFTAIIIFQIITFFNEKMALIILAHASLSGWQWRLESGVGSNVGESWPGASMVIITHNQPSQVTTWWEINIKRNSSAQLCSARRRKFLSGKTRVLDNKIKYFKMEPRDIWPSLKKERKNRTVTAARGWKANPLGRNHF